MLVSLSSGRGTVSILPSARTPIQVPPLVLLRSTVEGRPGEVQDDAGIPDPDLAQAVGGEARFVDIQVLRGLDVVQGQPGLLGRLVFKGVGDFLARPEGREEKIQADLGLGRREMELSHFAGQWAQGPRGAGG